MQYRAPPPSPVVMEEPEEKKRGCLTAWYGDFSLFSIPNFWTEQILILRIIVWLRCCVVVAVGRRVCYVTCCDCFIAVITVKREAEAAGED